MKTETVDVPWINDDLRWNLEQSAFYLGVKNESKYYFYTADSARALSTVEFAFGSEVFELQIDVCRSKTYDCWIEEESLCFIQLSDR